MMILRVRAVLEQTGLSRSSFYRQAANGSFGKKIRLGPNSVGYDADEVAKWCRDRPREEPSAGYATRDAE